MAKGKKSSKKKSGKKAQGSGKSRKKSPKLKAAPKHPAGKKAKAKKAPRRPADFSSVMISQVLRDRICHELGLTPREIGYLTKVVTSIHRAIGTLQREPMANDGYTLLASTIGPNQAVDLATLIKVAHFPELQDEVRSASQTRGSFIGPLSIKVLQAFVDKAVKVVRADASAS